jgi:dTDP-glucose pyrophosphorylase
MTHYSKHLIQQGNKIKSALAQLNDLAADAILFVVDADHRLLGSMTDGDVRRGFLRGLSFDNAVEDFIQANPKYIVKGEYSISQVIEYRKKNFRIVPVVDKDKRVVNVINFRFFKSYLPLHAIVMAGGRGERLKPLTDEVPKPLLPVGNKPIIEHNIDRLASYGIENFTISLRYRGKQIEDFLKDGSHKSIDIDYVWEEEPLGTIGAVRTVENLKHETILLTNSDLLTSIDYEDFYVDFLQSDAVLSVATIPYEVKIPYAVLETTDNSVLSFKEKPTYTYYSNAGIYLIRRESLKMIPKGFFNATDFMEMLLAKGMKINSYPMRSYWLDIGNPEDYAKAKHDINHINF